MGRGGRGGRGEWLPLLTNQQKEKMTTTLDFTRGAAAWVAETECPGPCVLQVRRAQGSPLRVYAAIPGMPYTKVYETGSDHPVTPGDAIVALNLPLGLLLRLESNTEVAKASVMS